MGPFLKFLQAARSMVKQGMTRDQVIAFAKQEFGEITKFMQKQIDNLFQKGPGGFLTPKKSKVSKKGDVVPIKKKEGIETLSEADQDIADIQKSIDDLDAAEAEADAFSALDKRTKDIAKGDPTGEVGEGIEGLETSIKRIKETAEELKKSTLTPESMFDDLIRGQQTMIKLRREGQVRTAVRFFMRQEEEAGRLKLRENDSKALREYSGIAEEYDPINIFRRYYGENALDAADDIADVFNQGESFDHYGQLLRENVDSKILTPKTKGLGDYDQSIIDAERIAKKAEKDAKNRQILEEFDPKDRTENADGGIIGNLRLNRTSFGMGSAPKGFKLAKKFRESPEYKKFIEMLFIKASNMIRQGKGMFKNLDESQRIKQHDNLTKEVTNFQKTGELNEGVHQYFGMNPEHAYAKKLMEMEEANVAALEKSREKVRNFKKLQEFDPGGRKPNAHGCLINLLKL